MRRTALNARKEAGCEAHRVALMLSGGPLWRHAVGERQGGRHRIMMQSGDRTLCASRKITIRPPDFPRLGRPCRAPVGINGGSQPAGSAHTRGLARPLFCLSPGRALDHHRCPEIVLLLRILRGDLSPATGQWSREGRRDRDHERRVPDIVGRPDRGFGPCPEPLLESPAGPHARLTRQVRLTSLSFLRLHPCAQSARPRRGDDLVDTCGEARGAHHSRRARGGPLDREQLDAEAERRGSLAHRGA